MKIMIAVDGLEFVHKYHDFIERYFPCVTKDLHIVHVIPNYSALVQTYPEIKQELYRQAEELVKKVTDYLAEMDAQICSQIIEGPVTQTILDYATQHEMDAILLGCRSLSNYSSLSLGSVSLGIANQSQIPVIIVK
ncbi:universal stress protein [Brevibacillus sp. SYSU BS000544]|uniref:universal stress protein n=1 Tax=Brevibacillus sp. SYSU BS000544 TaxID=3416443 RepID=UPI003CE4D64E